MKDIAAGIIQKAIKSGADQAEVFASNQRSLQIEVLDQKLESSNNISSGGIGLRIIKDKRLGFAYTAIDDEYSINELIRSSIENSKLTSRDDLLDFAEKIDQPREIKLYDNSSETLKFKDKLDWYRKYPMLRTVKLIKIPKPKIQKSFSLCFLKRNLIP